MQQLSQDPDEDIRLGVVWNKNLTDDIALSFLNDSSDSVREELALTNELSPNVVATILDSLYDDPCMDVRHSVTCNPMCTTSILHKLVTDSSALVRLGALCHKNIADEDIMLCIDDPNPSVADIAHRELQKRGIEV